jgi:hypothetical protein
VTSPPARGVSARLADAGLRVGVAGRVPLRSPGALSPLERSRPPHLRRGLRNKLWKVRLSTPFWNG